MVDFQYFSSSLISVSCVLLVCTVFSCNDDDLGLGSTSFIVTNDAFRCQDYAFYDLAQGDESINELWVYGDIVFYTNFDMEIKAYSISDGSTVTLSNDKSVQDVNIGDGKLYFCTTSGIYSIVLDNLNTFSQVSRYSCETIASAGERLIYFTGFNNFPDVTNTNTIYQFGVDGIVSEFSEPLDGDQIYSISILEDGSVLGYNQGNTNKFFRYDASGTLTNTFNAENAPIGINNFETEIWTEVIGNRYIVALKNGLGAPRLIEWSEENMAWHSYIDPDVIEAGREVSQEKYFDITAPSYSDITVEGSDVYITTTLAGCRGIQRIRITEGLLVTFADIEIIQDNGLEIGNCVQGIQFDAERSSKYVYSQKGLAVLSRCD